MGWDAIIGSDGVFVGMTTFGASAPYKELYKNFGITAEASRRGGIKQASLGRHGRVDPASICHSRWMEPGRQPGHDSSGVGSDEYDSSGCHQRVWPHRPQRPARHRRIAAARTSKSSASTISARSRPTPTCCAIDSVHGRFPGDSHGRGRHDQRRQRRHQGHRRSRTRPSCRGRTSASTSRWNAPASSPRRTRPRRI